MTRRMTAGSSPRSSTRRGNHCFPSLTGPYATYAFHRSPSLKAQPALQRPDSSLNLESPPGSADRVLPLLPLSEPATGTTTGAAATTHGTTAGRSASASAAQALGRGPLAHLRANAAAALAGLARRVSKSTVRSRSTPCPGVCVPSGPCPRRPCRRCTAASGR